MIDVTKGLNINFLVLEKKTPVVLCLLVICYLNSEIIKEPKGILAAITPRQNAGHAIFSNSPHKKISTGFSAITLWLVCNNEDGLLTFIQLFFI